MYRITLHVALYQKVPKNEPKRKIVKENDIFTEEIRSVLNAT